MAARSSSLFVLALLLLVSGSAIVEVANGDSCAYLSLLPGGCPDQTRCHLACEPCYSGVGRIEDDCVPPSTIVPMWECRCYFLDGAPCPPPETPGRVCPDPSVTVV